MISGLKFESRKKLYGYPKRKWQSFLEHNVKQLPNT